MESIGALASGIAHDLNNILTPIVMTAPMLRMDLPADDREQLLATLEASAQRAVEVIKQIWASREARKVIGRCCSRGTSCGRWRGSSGKPSRPRSPWAKTWRKTLWPVLGNATQLHQVLMNLCVNARDAMPRGGSLRLVARNVVLEQESPSDLPRPSPATTCSSRSATPGRASPTRSARRSSTRSSPPRNWAREPGWD